MKFKFIDPEYNIQYICCLTQIHGRYGELIKFLYIDIQCSDGKIHTIVRNIKGMNMVKWQESEEVSFYARKYIERYFRNKVFA